MPVNNLGITSSKPINYMANYSIDEKQGSSLNIVYEIYSEHDKGKRINNLRVETKSGTNLDKRLEEVFGKYIVQ